MPENGLYSVFLGFILMRNKDTDASESQPVVLDKLKSWGEKFFKEKTCFVGAALPLGWTAG